MYDYLPLLYIHHAYSYVLTDRIVSSPEKRECYASNFGPGRPI